MPMRTSGMGGAAKNPAGAGDCAATPWPSAVVPAATAAPPSLRKSRRLSASSVNEGMSGSRATATRRAAVRRCYTGRSARPRTARAIPGDDPNLSANRPTRSSQAAANASPPPAMVRRAPIFISSRSGPSGHHGRRKEQGKHESDRGRAADHHQFPPTHALREMQPERQVPRPPPPRCRSAVREPRSAPPTCRSSGRGAAHRH